MSFNSIKGHDNPINILKSYLEQERLAGGYLFAGPEGIGKKLVAKTLAKAVNCEASSLDACDQCPSCLKIENNQHPDIHVIDCEDSEIKIEYIRQLQREISFKPYEGKKKVFIIDKAHSLNAESSNALLKILEEPPKDSLIILITDRPSFLFKTILSRCKVIKFSALKRETLKEILKVDYGIANEMAHFFAYFSEGRIGYALRLQDSEILREKNQAIDRLALASRFNIESLPFKNKEEIRSHLNILATWFRDMYVLKIGMPHSEIINFDRKAELLKGMGRFTFTELNEIVESITEAITQLEQNINVRLLLYNLGAQLWKG